MLVGNADGSVDIYHDNTLRLSTTTSGITISDDLNVAGILTVSDYIKHLGDTDTAIRFPSNNTITAETSGSERVRITSAGDVGIGTVTAQKRLHVADYGSHGAIRVEGSGNGNRSGIEFYRETSAGVSKGGAAIWVESDTSSTDGKLRFGTASNAAVQTQNTDMILDHNGKLGIGSDAPSGTLSLLANNPNIRLDDSAGSSSNNGEITLDNTQLRIEVDEDDVVASSQIKFRVDGSDKMTLDSSGRLLIGATTEGNVDADDLTIETSSGYAGITLRSSTSDGGVIYFSDATSGAAEYDGQIVYSQASNSMVFATNQTASLTLNNAQNAKFVGIVSATEFIPTTIQTSYKNIIDNGDFQVNQRENQVTGKSNVNAVFTADRWKAIISNGGTYTIENTTEGPANTGLNKAYRFTCTTADNAGQSNLANADGYVKMEQRIEGLNVQVLKKGTSAATKISVQFWCKSNLTGTYNVELYDADNQRRVGSQFTVSASGTWEQKTFTFPGDTSGGELDNDNGDSLRFGIFLAAGNNFRTGTNSGSWAANTKNQRAQSNVNLSTATSNYFAITGVQVEPGSEPTPFEYIHYTENLQRCQRQFWSGNTLGAGVWNSATNFFCVWNPTVSMKSKPSISMKSGGLGNINIESSDLYNVTSMALGHTYSMPAYTHNATIVTFVISASNTADNGGVVCADANSDRFYLSAEF